MNSKGKNVRCWAQVLTVIISLGISKLALSTPQRPQEYTAGAFAEERVTCGFFFNFLRILLYTDQFFSNDYLDTWVLSKMEYIS